ncbi:MAG TPA: hypothetical protein VJ728_02450 [Candidatus Binataceae bacterium]|nr:hypothetical protein [Candidatus Binataceae bacterium]
MIVFQRVIAKFVRYRKVYLPSEAQLAELVNNLGPLDIVRAFWPAAVVTDHIRPIVETESKTTIVDLSKGLEAIWTGIHSSCRYKIRRAEKIRDRFEIEVNTDTARKDFLPFYNKFVRNKGNLPRLKPHQYNEFLSHADIFMLYFEELPTCGRLVLRDEESRTALMSQSVTRRLDPGTDTITVGLLNRYLYWHEMKTYQAAGIEKYDFGGVGQRNPSLAQFKLSFGGDLSTFKYCFYARTAQIVWKLVHSLYEFRRKRWFTNGLREPMGSDCY